jgi:hypothetical protein
MGILTADATLPYESRRQDRFTPVNSEAHNDTAGDTRPVAKKNQTTIPNTYPAADAQSPRQHHQRTHERPTERTRHAELADVRRVNCDAHHNSSSPHKLTEDESTDEAYESAKPSSTNAMTSEVSQARLVNNDTRCRVYNALASLMSVNDKSKDSHDWKKRRVPKCTLRCLIEALRKNGIKMETDPRLKEMYDYLKEFSEDKLLMEAEFFFCMSIFGENKLMVNALEDKLSVRDWPSLSKATTEIYDELLKANPGKNAQYIPVLRDADPDKLAISICSVDGQRFDIGDYRDMFSAQSMMKPLVYGMDLEMLGQHKVHHHVGKEPSGTSFNKLHLKPTDHGRQVPHNPLVNSGAIMCASLLFQHNIDDLDACVDFLKQNWEKLGAGVLSAPNPEFACPPLERCEETFKSERATGARNFALGYMMLEARSYPDNCDDMSKLKDILDLYFTSMDG